MSRVAIVAASLACAVSCRPAKHGFDLASTNTANTWQPVVSLPWLTYGGDFGGVAGWQTRGVASESRVDGWFERLSHDGVHAVVWFLFGDGRGALRFDDSGYVTGLAPEFFKDYRYTLESARRHHLQVIWVLLDFQVGMPARTDHGVPIGGHADLIEDTGKRRSFVTQALRPVLLDPAGEGTVAGWIVLNEPEHLLRSGYVSETAVRDYVAETAGEIHHYRPQDRVGLGSVNLAGMIQFADLQPLDFLMFHHYADTLPAPAAMVRGYLKESRPIYVSEFDWRDAPGGVDAAKFVQACRTLGYAGAWPWCLRSGSEADGDPQFDRAQDYVRAVRSQADWSDWAGGELRRGMGDLEKRMAVLEAEVKKQVAEAGENQRWAERCRVDLAKGWTASQQDLMAALERVRMHSYLAKEASSELGWLRYVEGQIGK